MPLVVALAAHFDSATTALAVLSASARIGVYVRRLYPFATSLSRTVDTIFSCVFLIFLIPFHLELGVEQTIHVLEWYVILSTTFRWHVLRIRHRHCENPLQTIMAHVVVAAKFRSLGSRDIVGETCKTFDSTETSGPLSGMSKEMSKVELTAFQAEPRWEVRKVSIQL